MQLFRCPNCQHWRCSSKCEDNSRLHLRCCQCGEVALSVKLYRGQAKGRPHDLDHSPRLGTGRAPGESKPIVESLMQFLERYDIPLNAFSRHTTISAWAIRQARAGVRNLSVTQENLVKRTMERIKAGRIWLRRKSRQRWDLERVVTSWKLNFDYIEPPPAYKPHCAMNLSHCHGGLLPASCPRQWKECILSGKDWEAIERIHRG